ncbi:MAG: hypothetical protein QOF70_2409 [Acetobacteraceae bacterium]|jgi:CheY-like chemotaxis protein|nr:hypothetical protein [Acetobacteraceae bacterium]
MASAERLLLVEDDVYIQYLLESELEEAGFEVAVASNGMRAIAALEADPNRFIAVITDINLGRGPSGWDIGRRGRQLGVHHRILRPHGTGGDPLPAPARSRAAPVYQGQYDPAARFSRAEDARLIRLAGAVLPAACRIGVTTRRWAGSTRRWRGGSHHKRPISDLNLQTIRLPDLAVVNRHRNDSGTDILIADMAWCRLSKR